MRFGRWRRRLRGLRKKLVVNEEVNCEVEKIRGWRIRLRLKEVGESIRRF